MKALTAIAAIFIVCMEHASAHVAPWELRDGTSFEQSLHVDCDSVSEPILGIGDADQLLFTCSRRGNLSVGSMLPLDIVSIEYVTQPSQDNGRLLLGGRGVMPDSTETIAMIEPILLTMGLCVIGWFVRNKIAALR